MIDQKDREELLQQLPQWIEKDPAFRVMLARLLHGEFADKKETESRFDQLLDELRRDREEQARKWDEAMAESKRMREEQNRKWEEQNRKWEEQNRKWEEQNHKWEEQNRKWEEQNRKWDESRKDFLRVHEEIMALSDRLDRKVSAMGARWGIMSERAFRNALAGILEKTFGVQVLNVNEFDEQGEVFGRPDQIELDVVIKNGSLLILELKSSISKSDLYAFERKARFYEKRHDRRADRLIVVSPMIDDQARVLAPTLGIEVYSDADEVRA